MSKLSKSVAQDSDKQLLEGIRRGESEAIAELYEDYFPMILNMVVSNNGSSEEAQDIFQEAIIVLYDKVQDGKFELSSKLKTYLYSICRRLWLKQLNDLQRSFYDISGYEDYIPVDDDLEKHKEKEFQFGQMEEALNKLGEPCRTIIRDFYILNLSMPEICEKFGYTNTDNAKTQKYKCLQRLKKLFFTTNKNS